MKNNKKKNKQPVTAKKYASLEQQFQGTSSF